MANKKVSQLVSKPSVLVTDLFPIADPTTGQLFKTTISDLGTAIGSGVSSVNTLVGAVVLDTDDIQELASPTNRWFTDTRARAALSASSPLAYNSGTGVFSLPQADGSTNGFLSSADWTTFNNKLSTATAASTYVPYTGATANVNLGLNYSLTAALIIKSGGTSTQFLKADGSIDTNTYLTTGSAASTYLALAGGTLTGALNGTSATFTGDLTLSATNPRLYFTDTDNNPDYFISNTDGTFTVYDVTNSTSRFTIGTTGNGTFGGNLTVGQIIRSGGTSSQFLKADGSVDSTAYLPLTGGTLTGNLNGTNITISNSLIAKGGTFNGGALSSGIVTIDGLGSNVLMNRTDTNNGTLISFLTDAVEKWHIGMRSGGTDNFVIYNSNLLANAVSVNVSNSAVTLTGALSGTSATFSDSSNTILTLNSTNTNGYTATQINYSGVAKALIGFGTYLTTDGGVAIRTAASTPFTIAIGGGTPTMTLATSGAATFSSSVTQSGHLDILGGSLSSTNGLHQWFNTSTNQAWIQAFQSGVDWRQINYNAAVHNFLINDVTTLYVSNSRNVGIGTTAPGKRLDVFTTATSATEYQLSLRNGAGANNVSTGIAFGFNSSSLDPDYLSAISSIVTDRSTRAADLTFLTSATGTLTERMRITSGGALLVGTTSTSGVATGSSLNKGMNIDGFNGTLSVQRNDDGNIYLSKASGYSSGNLISFYVAGSIVGSVSTNGTTTAYNITSDYRLKEDLKPINGLDIVNKIKVYDYKWKADNSRMDGFLAHELQEVLPYAVTGVKDGEQMQGVDYSKIVPVMVQAIKDLKAELDTLKNK